MGSLARTIEAEHKQLLCPSDTVILPAFVLDYCSVPESANSPTFHLHDLLNH